MTRVELTVDDPLTMHVLERFQHLKQRDNTMDRPEGDLTYRAENGSLFDGTHWTMGHLIGECMAASLQDHTRREAVNALHAVHHSERQVFEWVRSCQDSALLADVSVSGVERSVHSDGVLELRLSAGVKEWRNSDGTVMGRHCNGDISVT